MCVTRYGGDRHFKAHAGATILMIPGHRLRAFNKTQFHMELRGIETRTPRQPHQATADCSGQKTKSATSDDVFFQWPENQVSYIR